MPSTVRDAGTVPLEMMTDPQVDAAALDRHEFLRDCFPQRRQGKAVDSDYSSASHDISATSQPA